MLDHEKRRILFTIKEYKKRLLLLDAAIEEFTLKARMNDTVPWKHVCDNDKDLLHHADSIAICLRSEISKLESLINIKEGTGDDVR